MRQLTILLIIAIFSLPNLIMAQSTDSIPVLDYTKPSDFEIGGIKVTGAEFSDENAIIAIAGFKVGDKVRIPGGDIPRAMKNLWKLRLFTDVQIYKEKELGDIIFLEIAVTERPRLSRHSYKGVKKTYHDDLNEEVNKFLLKGGIVTENVKTNASNGIKQFFIDKGYYDVAVNVEEIPDSVRVNSVRLVFDVNKGGKVKINDITFSGVTIKESKLRRLMKETKRQKALFSSSKFIQELYEEDKQNIINYYNTIGFRDADIVNDSIWRNEEGKMMIHLDVYEGSRYYFRDIKFKGNSIYDTETLERVLGIESGEVYNQELLETRLSFSEDGRDVSTLYMDNGYLFFRVDPIETSIVNDSIDLEIRIYEGPQATIDKVTIAGNDRTHEHVIRRELRTIPGAKFSRSDIIRSQRELINLGYFNPEALGINTPVNPQRGTVDIEYTVEERPSDQLELSAGWGGRGRGVIGTLGVSFNNFSVRNIFKKGTWSPLPQGDGQRLSLRAQTNGRFFQSYNASFTEPWLGGKKPNSFTAAGYLSIITNGLDRGSDNFGRLINGGLTLSLGTRLKWPDDNFITTTSLNLQNISLQNYNVTLFRTDDGTAITDGTYHNFSINQTIARSTINNPLFPDEGSRISLSVQFTLPYSLFSDKDYQAISPQERFEWLEYHKWRVDAEWYTTLVGKLVLKTQAKFGFIGSYNKDVGLVPFERFELGGDGLNNQQLGFYTGTDIISLRGYDPSDLENNRLNENSISSETVATPIFNKLTVELRYPISTNPNSTIFVLAFAQGGNAWRNAKDFNPFDLKRSVGGGLRVFLPMFGLLGFDYGIGLDKYIFDDQLGDVPVTGLGNMARFSIILGFEPE
jgi:outer membrane protein insertion porin family